MSEEKEAKQAVGTETIKFLSDQPLTADKEQDMRFGHPGIAENLRSIVLKCPVPFTVGLFGKWGSGKTTILNLLKSKLQHDEKVGIVNFDVWKYEGDSLRRTFLKELVEQLKNTPRFPKDFKPSERLESQIKKTVGGKLIWNLRSGLVLVGFVVALVLIGIFLHFCFPTHVGTYFSIILGGGFVLSFFVWILQQTLTSETLTTTYERFKDPHEFEAEFRRIVHSTSSEKLLVIIDNLDRCSHSKTVELLSTIKTFLAKDTDINEDNKCLFLIACDDEAIKAHLRTVYKIEGENGTGSSFSADEFLRKFFNTFLRIPDFIDTEIQTYTVDLLKETRVSEFDSQDVAYVISAAFRENPRQIKQFINTLIAHFLLAKQREARGEIERKGTITNNIAFLAKFLIIHQEHLSEYHEICRSYRPVEEWKGIEKSPDEFKKFLRATKPIDVSDIRPFIYLKQSKDELAIPRIRELELALINNDREKVRDILKDISETPKQVDSLKIILPDLIKRNSGRGIRLLNIVSSSLDGLHQHSLDLNLNFYNTIADLLNDEKGLKPNLAELEPSFVFNGVLARCSHLYRSGIIAQYINILREEKEPPEEPEISTDYAISLFRELLQHKDWLSRENKKYLKRIIAESYHPSVEILSLFKDVEDQKDFISKETVSQFVSTLSNDDVENIKSLNGKIHLIFELREIVTPDIAQVIIQKMTNLLTNENSKPHRPQKEKLLEHLGNLFETLYEQIKNVADKAILNSFASTIIEGVKALGNWNERKIFVFTCLKLVDMLEAPLQSEVNTFIEDFFRNANLDSLKFVFAKLKEEEQEKVIQKYVGPLQEKAIPEDSFFHLLYPLAPEDIRIQWMRELITKHPQRALPTLQKLNYEVDDKKGVVETLLQTAPNAQIQDRKGLYEAVNEMKCATDTDLRETLASQIISHLKNTDQEHQKVGYQALEAAKHLSDTVRRQIAREITETLRLKSPEEVSQFHSAVRSIMVNWSVLGPTVQRDYIDFISNKLIERGVNTDSITLGFEVLSVIKPKYEDYTSCFEDILTRAETEGNDQIKTELRNGLSKLKPPKTNKANREFWEKLEKLSSQEK